jgi:hypothetical protein
LRITYWLANRLYIYNSNDEITTQEYGYNIFYIDTLIIGCKYIYMKKEGIFL